MTQTIENPFMLEGLCCSEDFTFLNPRDYYLDLTARMQVAESRIYLQTMSYEADHTSNAIFDLMKKRVNESNLEVAVNIDGFANMITDGHMDVLPILDPVSSDYRDFRKARKLQEIKSLIDSGIEVKITHPVTKLIEQLSPAQNRSHVKLAVVDGVSYLGGLNLSDAGFSRPDFMIRIFDPVITKHLVSIFKSPPFEDTVFYGTENTSLLYDSGKPGKSVILSTAIEIINKSADNIWLTSQFIPDGAIVSALYKAYQRGVDVNILSSDPTSIDEPHSYMFNRLSQLRYLFSSEKIPIIYHPRWIHAKLLMVDSHTPYAKALAGTHNFSGVGVKWGNEEAAILSCDPSF